MWWRWRRWRQRGVGKFGRLDVANYDNDDRGVFLPGDLQETQFVEQQRHRERQPQPDDR
ncbi:hypothetical protein BVI1335_400059 [Burkholderia vietnamiensis]|nr:hypothetical protein BVI1335_400059 [Burkholderia vietnamiensis]